MTCSLATNCNGFTSLSGAFDLYGRQAMREGRNERCISGLVIQGVLAGNTPCTWCL